jgi:hypothetical protein
MRGRPNTGDREVCSLFCVKQAPVCSSSGSGFGTYSPSAPILIEPGIITVGAVAIENAMGAV